MRPAIRERRRKRLSSQLARWLPEQRRASRFMHRACRRHLPAMLFGRKTRLWLSTARISRLTTSRMHYRSPVYRLPGVKMASRPTDDRCQPRQGRWTVTTRDLSLGTATIASDVRITAGVNGGPPHRRQDRRRPRHGSVALLSAVDRQSGASARCDHRRWRGECRSARITVDLAERSFRFRRLERRQANIRLGFGSLDLSGNLATRDGQMKLDTRSRQADNQRYLGRRCGRQVDWRTDTREGVERRRSDDGLKLDQAKLSSFSPTAKGTGDVRSRSGRDGRKVRRACMAVMAGSGSMSSSKGRKHSVLRQSRRPRISSTPSCRARCRMMFVASRRRFRRRSIHRQVEHRRPRLAMTVADGSVKFDTAALDAPDGKSEATATTDLTSLNVSAAYQVSPIVRPLPPPAVPLPGVEAATAEGAAAAGRRALRGTAR